MQDRARDKEEIQRLKTRVESIEITTTLAAMDKDRIKRELYSIRFCAIDKLIVDRVTKVVAAALAQHEGNRANVARVRAEAIGPVRVEMWKKLPEGNCWDMLRGIWFEKMELVFQISKYVDEDMVKYVVCNLESRALTWWNDHVHSLGIDAANRIP
ncbi:hypothetical protein Tco_1527355 [Tanacetum coccineum]